MTDSVPVAFQINENNIEIRGLSLHRAEEYEGGYARFQLGPREKRIFHITEPCRSHTLLLVGGQTQGSVPEGQPVFCVRAGKSNINILGRQFPPTCPSAVPSKNRPAVARVVRTYYRGLTGESPHYTYTCPIPLGRRVPIETIEFENLTDNVTVAIDGIAFLPDIRETDDQQELAVVGPGIQRTIQLQDFTNADYQHHVFRERDEGPWSFFPLLKKGVYESKGIRFNILPSFNETGEWPVVGILHKDKPLSMPLPTDQYDGISLAWVAYGTYSIEDGRFPSEEIAVVRFLCKDGTMEDHSIVSHRDIFDYRDLYVAERFLVYQEALYQKICRTDLLIRHAKKHITSMEIQPAWEEGEIGIALFAATAWREERN